LASLKTIPSVLLERKLKFNLLVIVEISEALLFYGLAVFLAWRGFGVLSYAWAVLARGITGVILIYIISPWKIGFALRKDSLKHLLRFGVPYQANTFLSVIKDRLMNVFLWKIVGATGVGILGWAQKWAQMPLRFIMDAVIKVTFPAYARMQEKKEELTAAIEKTLFFISFLVFPLLLGMAILARSLVTIIPEYSKWEIALIALYLFIVNSFWGSVTTPLTNALTAIGKIKVVFKLMVMWTVLTWIIYPILAVRYGFNGVAFGAALVATSSVIAIWIAKKHLTFRFFYSIIKPLAAAIFMGFFVWIIKFFLPVNIFVLVGLVLAGGIVYFALVYLMVGKSLILDLRKLIYAIKAKL